MSALPLKQFQNIGVFISRTLTVKCTQLRVSPHEGQFTTPWSLYPGIGDLGTGNRMPVLNQTRVQHVPKAFRMNVWCTFSVLGA